MVFPGPRLSILIFHRVLSDPDPLQPGIIDVRGFARRMRWLKRFFRILPLAEAVERLQTGALPQRAACLTFDDGYADNAENALPILNRLGIPATFFVATGYLDGGRMWNDTVIEAIRRWESPWLPLPGLDMDSIPVRTVEERRLAIPKVLGLIKYLPPEHRQQICEEMASGVPGSLPKPMMGSEQVGELAASGMDIGAHTRSHPILTRIPLTQARSEIEGSRKDLEAITGRSVTCFAYPNGKPGDDYAREHVNLVAELGFSAAVSTARGAAGKASHPLELPRFTPWDRTSARFMARLLYTRLAGTRERAASGRYPVGS